MRRTWQNFICVLTSIAISVLFIDNAGAVEILESYDSLDDEDDSSIMMTRRLPELYEFSSMIPQAFPFPTRRPSAFSEPIGFHIPKNRLVDISHSDAIQRLPWSKSGTVHYYPTKAPRRRPQNPYGFRRGARGDGYPLMGVPSTSPTRSGKFQDSRRAHRTTGNPRVNRQLPTRVPPTRPFIPSPLDEIVNLSKQNTMSRFRPDQIDKEYFEFTSPISLNAPPLQNMDPDRELSDFSRSSQKTFSKIPRRPTRNFEIANQKLEKYSNSSKNSSLDDSVGSDMDELTTLNPSLASSKGFPLDGQTTGTVFTEMTAAANTSKVDDLSVSLADEDESGITGGAIAGIVIGALSSVALLAGIALFVMYKRPFGKSPHVDHPSQNNVYIDDTIHVGYLNHHIELPKESPEEMTSLDNDSFLNSLEAVTIQNYWADNTRNTKV